MPNEPGTKLWLRVNGIPRADNASITAAGVPHAPDPAG
jgi:hypothetical protein